MSVELGYRLRRRRRPQGTAITGAFLVLSFVVTAQSPPERLKTVANRAFAADTYPDAYAIIDSAVETSHRLGHRRDAVVYRGYIAHVAYAQGDLARMQRVIEECLRESRALGDSALVRGFRSNLAVAYQAQGKSEESIRLLSRAASVARASDDTLALAKAQNNLAVAYHATGRVDEATSAMAEAMALYRALGSPNYAQSVSNLLGLYIEAGRYADAVGIAPRAIELAVASEDDLALGVAHQAYGEANTRLGNYALAERHLELARGRLPMTSDRKFASVLYSSLFNLYEATDRPALALAAIDSAMANSFVGDYHTFLGTKLKYLIEHGRADGETAGLIDSIYVNGSVTGNTRDVLLARQLRIAHAIALGQPERAGALADVLAATLDTTPYLYWSAELALQLSEAYEAVDNYALANRYLDSAYSITARLSARELAGSNAVGQRERDVRDREIAEQRLAITEAEITAARRRWLLGALALLALLGGVIIVQQVRSRRREREQGARLAENNAELARANALLAAATEDAYHRVRNDYQAVRSYVDLLAASAAEEGTQVALAGAARQIDAMGEINSVIARAQVSGDPSPEELLRDYFETLPRKYADRDFGLSLPAVSDGALAIRTAEFKWVAMILDESITNAAKYGDYREGGALAVSIVREPGGTRLEVANPISPATEISRDADAPPTGHAVLLEICRQMGWSYSTTVTDRRYVATLRL